jgi:hypothetical protein
MRWSQEVSTRAAGPSTRCTVGWPTRSRSLSSCEYEVSESGRRPQADDLRCRICDSSIQPLVVTCVATHAPQSPQ